MLSGPINTSLDAETGGWHPRQTVLLSAGDILVLYCTVPAAQTAATPHKDLLRFLQTACPNSLDFFSPSPCFPCFVRARMRGRNGQPKLHSFFFFNPFWSVVKGMEHLIDARLSQPRIVKSCNKRQRRSNPEQLNPRQITTPYSTKYPIYCPLRCIAIRSVLDRTSLSTHRERCFVCAHLIQASFTHISQITTH